MKVFNKFLITGLIIGLFSITAQSENSDVFDLEMLGISVEDDNGRDRDRDRDRDGKDKDRHNPCHKIKLTADQKSQLKEAHKNHELAMVDYQAAVKKARISYRHVLKDMSSTSAQADAAAQVIAEKRGDMVLGRLGFRNEVLYDIVTQRQRRPMMMCMRHMRKHKRGRGKLPRNIENKPVERT